MHTELLHQTPLCVAICAPIGAPCGAHDRFLVFQMCSTYPKKYPLCPIRTYSSLVFKGDEIMITTFPHEMIHISLRRFVDGPSSWHFNTIIYRIHNMQHAVKFHSNRWINRPDEPSRIYKSGSDSDDENDD